MNRAEKCFTVACVVLFFGFIYLFLGAVDKLDRHNEVGTVVSIERLDVQKVYIEIGNGNTSVEEFELDTPIDIGDKAEVEVKEFEDGNPNNDEPVKFIKWVE